MNWSERRLKLAHLDRQLLALGQAAASAPRPDAGWVRTIREALGMGLEAFAHRMGITKSTASDLELSEVADQLSVARLRRAADALGCDLVVALVPRVPLESMAKEQAYRVAESNLQRVAHTMALESQEVSPDFVRENVAEYAADILRKGRMPWN